MKNNLLLSTLLVATLATAGFASDIDGLGDEPNDSFAPTTSPTMEVALSYGLMNFGGSYKNDDGSYDLDTEDTPLMISFSFLSPNDNRWGFYYKSDEVSFSDRPNSYSTNTFGLLGEIGLSSIKRNIGEGELLPYVGYGVGYGSADASFNSDLDVVTFEMDLSVGVNYTIQSFEVSAALYRRAISFINDANTDTFALNGINIGVGYKF
jgi:opacity protein-like surface antigen